MFIKNIGGFVSGIIRSAVRLGYSVLGISEILEEAELPLSPEEVLKQYDLEVAQPPILEEIGKLESQYAIPEALHVRTPVRIPQDYWYDVKVTYVTEEHELIESYRSVGSDFRLSQDQILADAELLSEAYPEEGAMEWAVEEISGSWTKGVK